MPKRRLTTEFTPSSGNIFADLGVPNPDEELAKTDLANQILQVIRERKLTQVQAAKLMGVDQPRVSAIARGRLKEFSLERLLRFVLLLGHDINIVVKKRPRTRQQACVRVMVA